MNNREIAEKYLQGDPDAMVLLDVAIGVAVDLNYLRQNQDHDDYISIRVELDEEIDELSPQIAELGLVSKVNKTHFGAWVKHQYLCTECDSLMEITTYWKEEYVPTPDCPCPHKAIIKLNSVVVPGANSYVSTHSEVPSA
jgi:hypothetical protein